MNGSDIVNDVNVFNVLKQIEIKKQDSPYLATLAQSRQVHTDFDVFPYNRWFRGQPTSSQPVVAEREAGFRVLQDDCYKCNDCSGVCESKYPNHCFQSACSTTYICNPKYLNKYSDKEQMELLLHDDCIVKYR